VIAWINFAVMLFASLLFLYYYVLSVSPAAREQMGVRDAYRRCAHDRVLAIIFEMLSVASYVVYYFYPLPVPLPASFPWGYWLSVLLAILIGVPALGLMIWGLVDAGEEAVRPKKEHHLYTGIYARIRHPQAAGEVFIWLVIALLLNSPFLVIFSLVYFPIFLLMCLAEEKDLLLRFGEAYAAYSRRTGAFLPIGSRDQNK